MQVKKFKRRGAVVVESAVILPVLFLLVIGMCVLGPGIFHYQQVATLAREGARYASVHGTQYAAEQSVLTKSKVLPADYAEIYNKALLPRAVAMDTDSIVFDSSSVVWPNGKSPIVANPNSTPPGAPLIATVSVTVKYNWIPVVNFINPVMLSSTATMPMSY
jgi:Flp pilus assembly protein TadG